MARFGAAVLEEALVAAALSGDEVIPLRVRVSAGDSPGTLCLGVARTGRDPVELRVNLLPVGS